MWLGVDIDGDKKHFQVGCIIACFIDSNDCVGDSWYFTDKKVNKWSVGGVINSFPCNFVRFGGSRGGMYER